MPNRIATEQDASSIHCCNVGDFIIDPDDQPGEYKHVYLRSDSGWLGGGNNPALGPGSKILINAEHTYSRIDLYMGAFSGAPGNPIIVTQYNGQLRVIPESFSDIGRRLSLLGAKYVKITFEYENGVSGDSDYPGAKNGWNSFPSGTFGAYISGEWKQYCSLLSIGKDNFWTNTDLEASYSTAVEVYGCEIGNGGFAGIRAFNNLEHDSFLRLTVKRCYIHDTDSEGVYIGKNTTEGRVYVFFENCLFARTGTEIFQVGNACESSVAKSCVFVNSSLASKDPFTAFQLGGVQWHSRYGKHFFRDNIFIGTYASPIAYFGGYKEDDGVDIDLEFREDDDAVYFTNNFFAQCVVGETYLNISGDVAPDSDALQQLIIENNYIDTRKPDGDSNEHFFLYNSGGVKYDIIIRNNTYQQGVSGVDLAVTGAVITEEDNTEQEITYPVFVRDGLTEKGITWWDLKLWGIWDYWSSLRGDTDIETQTTINLTNIEVDDVIQVEARYNRFTGSFSIGDEYAFLEIPDFIDHRIMMLTGERIENYFFATVEDFTVNGLESGNFDSVTLDLKITEVSGSGAAVKDLKFTKREWVAEFEQGEYLLYKSKLYQAKEFTRFESPEDEPDKYTQITWDNDSDLPPDNYNLTNDLYRSLGMGLMQASQAATGIGRSKKTLISLTAI